MAGSKKTRHGSLMHLRDQMLLPARTPGILGANDAGDPTRLSLLGTLRGAVLQKDLVWIYLYFESMRRVWLNSDPELVGRRHDELALIFPYVIHDIKHEAVLQGFPFK